MSDVLSLTPKQREAVEAFRRHQNGASAARELRIQTRTLWSRIYEAEARMGVRLVRSARGRLRIEDGDDRDTPTVDANGCAVPESMEGRCPVCWLLAPCNGHRVEYYGTSPAGVALEMAPAEGTRGLGW